MLDRFFEKVRSLFGGTTNAAKREYTGKEEAEGVIVYFNHRKGYGFVKSPDVEERVFLHVSELEGRASKGKKVVFATEQSSEGIRAVKARIVTV